MKGRIMKAVKILGSMLMISACLFIVSRLFAIRKDIKWEQIEINKLQITVEILGYAAAMLISPLTYKILVQTATDRKVSFYDVQYICCKSNIYKYLPGNVFQYIGRNQLAIDQGLKHSQVALATIMELMITSVSAIIITLVFARSDAIVWLEKYVDLEMLIKAGCVMICLIVVLAFLLKSKLRSFGNTVKDMITVKRVIAVSKAVVWSCFILILNGILFCFVFMILGSVLTLDKICTIIGLFALSFCIGFITPGAPAGIGVRETILLLFMGNMVEESQIVTATVIFRMISVLGDILAYCFAEVVSVIRRNGIRNEFYNDRTVK